MSDGARLCEECRQPASPAAPPVLTLLGPDGADWSPVLVLLLLLLAVQIGWLIWAAVQNIALHGLGDSLFQLLELCGTGFVPFGLVAADLW